LPKKVEIVPHLPSEEVRKLHKREKDKTKALRLLAIYHLMRGKTPGEVVDLLQMDKSTIYRLTQRWNEKGSEGLEDLKKGPKINHRRRNLAKNGGAS